MEVVKFTPGEFLFIEPKDKHLVTPSKIFGRLRCDVTVTMMDGTKHHLKVRYVCLDRRKYPWTEVYEILDPIFSNDQRE